jgi:DUF1365 family protein
MHRRLRPRLHHFRYRSFWLLIDLDELPWLSSNLRLFSHNRPNVFSLYDSDHGDGSSTPLRMQAERQLRSAGLRPDGGRVQLLCMPRSFGHCFNPLSIYFCHDASGHLPAMIYQVHNTFGERHSYVIRVAGSSETVRQQCRKAFHVSPFLEMALAYEFRVLRPDKRIAVGIRVTKDDEAVLVAGLVGVRRALSDRTLVGLGLTMPAITIKTLAGIHWEALRLWLKGLRYHPKPAPPRDAISVTPVTSRH